MKKLDTTTNEKIIILTSTGGGGHTSASNALESYLRNDYDVQSINVFKELLINLDIFKIITCNKYSGEELYNVFIPKKYFRLLAWFYSFGAWYIQLRKKRIHAILRDYFINTKPALIISVIPIINNIILDVAQELDIPFLLIPADLDITMYLLHITNPSYKQFYIGLAFDDEQIMMLIKKACIPENQLFVIGAPLQTDFFTLKNKVLLKKKYSIPENKPVIMVLMGARGSHDIEKYAAQLLKIQSPLHLILCIGKNGDSKNKLDNLIIPSHITVSIVNFTNHMVEYMAMADILISKSGSQSVCEALYINTPLFLDATSALLPWEAFNHIFIKKHNFGEQIKRYDHVSSRISYLIENPEKLMTYKNNLEQLQKTNCQEALHALLAKIAH